MVGCPNHLMLDIPNRGSSIISEIYEILTNLYRVCIQRGGLAIPPTQELDALTTVGLEISGAI